MLILQLTDFHVTPAGASAGGVDNRAAFTRLLDSVRALQTRGVRPDLIVVSGDVANAGEPEAYRFAAEGLRSLRTPFVVVPGNHDHRENLRAAFADETGQEAGHLGVRRQIGDLSIIGLDTLVEGSAHGEISSVQLEWLTGALAAAASGPVLIVMHHPPFLTGMPAMDAIGLQAGCAQLAHILGAYGQVAGVLCGHVHRPVYGRFGDIPAVVAPSTSHQFALELPHDRGFEVVQEPPQMMLHKMMDKRLVSMLIPA